MDSNTPVAKNINEKRSLSKLNEDVPSETNDEVTKKLIIDKNEDGEIVVTPVKLPEENKVGIPSHLSVWLNIWLTD